MRRWCYPFYRKNARHWAVKRREFITLLGGAAAACPLAARARQPVPVVGFLRSTSATSFAHLVAELAKGLSEEGFVEGRNVIIEQRWGDNQPDRLPGLAANLVHRKAAVIVGNTPAVLAAVRVAGPTVPLVFVVGRSEERRVGNGVSRRWS